MSIKCNKNAPIGVFDSGVGGLTVAREIMRQLPKEHIVYYILYSQYGFSFFISVVFIVPALPLHFKYISVTVFNSGLYVLY